MKQEGVERIVGDKNIGTSVTIVVRHAYAHPLPDVAADAPLLGNILEGPVTFVQVKLIGQALIRPWVAIFRQTLVPAARLLFIVPANVIDDEQVQQTVAIYVNPSRSHGPVRTIFRIGTIQAGFCRYIGECPVPIVTVEGIAMDSGDKQIGIPVVVEVANRHTHVVTRSGQSRLSRYIRKHTVSIVTKQAVGELNVIFL